MGMGAEDCCDASAKTDVAVMASQTIPTARQVMEAMCFMEMSSNELARAFFFALSSDTASTASRALRSSADLSATIYEMPSIVPVEQK